MHTPDAARWALHSHFNRRVIPVVEPVLDPLSYKVILPAAAPHHVARGTHPSRMPHEICEMLFGSMGTVRGG